MLLSFLFSLKKFPYTYSPAQKVNGQIKGEELHQTINSMVVTLSDSEFKELMQTLDPRGSGLVNIHRFLALLEEGRKTVSTAAAPRGPGHGHGGNVF